jgi:predicted nucleotidyltransferase
MFVVDPELEAAVARAVQPHPDVELVVLFGSVVKGRALPSSDADVGIRGGSFWVQLEIGSQVGALLAREPHVVDLRAASTVLAYEVARTGVLLFEREPAAWPRFRAQALVQYLDFQPLWQLCAAGAKKRLLREARRG